MRERDKQTQRQTDRETNRQRHKQAETQRDRGKDRQKRILQKMWSLKCLSKFRLAYMGIQGGGKIWGPFTPIDTMF